jgi:hypothetical protein
MGFLLNGGFNPVWAMDITVLGFLFVAGLAAGFVDSIAGGGGLISLPALLSVGIPPQLALGTNKLQGTFGVMTAAVNYTRKGRVDLKECTLGIVSTFIGAMSGAWVIQRLSSDFIRNLVPFLLLLVLAYTIVSKNLGLTDQRAKIPHRLFYLLFGLTLGFYDGFFGPGTGSFWTVSLVAFSGYNLTKAVGVTKIMNFTSNFVALVVFVIGGNVYYSAGIVMAIGQIIGARLGSNLAIKRGAGFIRPLFITVVLATTLRLIYLNYLV